MSTKRYEDRRKMHDLLAMPAVDELFRLDGYDWEEMGVEREKEKFRKALSSRLDPLALKIRFHPDRVYTKSGYNSIACEIKSEYVGRENFAIEYDSYSQALKWPTECEYTYAFVEIIKILDNFQCNIRFCFAKILPSPYRFYVPKRNDYKQFVDRIKKEFPEINVKLKKHKSGSGTPYILVSKNIKELASFADFFGIGNRSALNHPVLFAEDYSRIDTSKKEDLYTHAFCGGVFFRLGRYPAWAEANGIDHLSPIPMITYVMTLSKGFSMAHRTVWTFTDIQFDELMIEI